MNCTSIKLGQMQLESISKAHGLLFYLLPTNIVLLAVAVALYVGGIITCPGISSLSFGELHFTTLEIVVCNLGGISHGRK